MFSPFCRQNSWLRSWAQPYDSGGRDAPGLSVDLGPGSAVGAGGAWLYLAQRPQPAHSCGRQPCPVHKGFRGAGGREVVPHLTQLTQPLILAAGSPQPPAPGWEPSAWLGPMLIHVTCPASAAGRATSLQLGCPSLGIRQLHPSHACFCHWNPF
jgi:hypothetical protein